MRAPGPATLMPARNARGAPMKWWTAQPERKPAGARGAGADKASEPPPSRIPPRQAWWTFLIILLVNYLVVRSLFPDSATPVTIPYTVFREQIAKGNVKSIYSQGVSIEGRFASALTWPPPGRETDARGASAPALTREGWLRSSKTVEFLPMTLPSAALWANIAAV